MKTFLKILIFSFILPLSGQNKNDSVFIEKKANSPYYGLINKFKFSDSDNETYQYSLKKLRDMNIKLNKKHPVIQWEKWIEIKKYKGKFYAYKPCDFYFHYKNSINDSTFIDWTGEGPFANKIINQKKTDKNTYVFYLVSTTWSERTQVIVHIIDAGKGIAVFEHVFSDGERRKHFMIASEKLTQVPIIVNNCNQKGAEFEFDDTEKIDIKIKEDK